MNHGAEAKATLERKDRVREGSADAGHFGPRAGDAPPLRRCSFASEPLNSAEMFGRRKPPEAQSADEHLFAAVRAALPGADEQSIAVVAACAGLLAVVAYADREFSPDEQQHVLSSLETVSGIGSGGARAISSVLQAHVRELSTVHLTRFTRRLKELGDRDLRLHVLEMLIELCAADGELGHHEVVLLRQTTRGLGLDQDDYNRLQSRHRGALGSHRSRP